MKKVIGIVSVLLAFAILVFIGVKIITTPKEELEVVGAKQSLIDAGYTADNFDILKKYGIIDDNTDEYIKVRDALVVFIKATGNKIHKADFSYLYDELTPLEDTLDDETKNILMSLMWVRGNLVTQKEMLMLDYNANITEFEALRCAIRMVGNTYDCTGECEEVEFSEIEDVYNRAYEKGIIDSLNYKNANEPILRKNFYDIISRALYVEFKRGSYGGVFDIKYIDRFIEE